MVRRAIRLALGGLERQVGTPRSETARASAAITSAAAGQAWARDTRISALLGSCPRSIPQFSSGFEGWVLFARSVLKRSGRELPPTVEGLLLW